MGRFTFGGVVRSGLRNLSAILLLVTLGSIGPTPSLATPTATSRALVGQAALTITGVDLHDGMITQSGGLYYLVGTEYSCGFQWQVSGPWCGFGVSTSASLSGPWSPPVLLFPPSATDPFRGQSWNQVCSAGGTGCFNPRMVLRPDGVWVLWFNSPNDYFSLRANGYNVMGCNSPLGPCGPTAGPPNGSFDKPAAYTCGAADGDESIVTDGATAYLECTGADRSEYVEELDAWWANGTGNIAGHGAGPMFANVEGAGAYRDATSGLWVSTLSWPECGYCNATHTIYMTSPSPLGPWSSPPTLEVGGASSQNQYSRASVSGASCGGQPRTVDILDGQPYQQIDLWTGQRNEATAGIRLEPLNFHNPNSVPGQPWQPFDPFTCS